MAVDRCFKRNAWISQIYSQNVVIMFLTPICQIGQVSDKFASGKSLWTGHYNTIFAHIQCTKTL